ncbi:hypothetical protein [Kosakonia sp.]|uniref:hypothetical protein n=1 Tax=Kosakonia sp. TaxID=1916651 RepID=UPI00289CF06C|nr:hypothetical protein [Kosakonia sp.]
MTSSEREQLTDELIGVAVLSLLNENAPISTLALIRRLQAMEASEPDSQRRETLGNIIAEISSDNFAGAGHKPAKPSTPWDDGNRDNVYHLFSLQQPSGGSKKH